MRRWLLIHSDGDKLSDKATAEIDAFTSWDEDEPAAGDLNTAILALTERLAGKYGASFRRDLLTETTDFILVSLDDAKTISVNVSPSVDIVSTGSVY